MKMTKDMLPSGTEAELADRLVKAYEPFDATDEKFTMKEVGKGTNIFKAEETQQNKRKRMDVMKAVLEPYTEMVKVKLGLSKASISTGSNLTPYDLRAPSLHLVPWLSPIRESLPRVKRPSPGTVAHWTRSR